MQIHHTVLFVVAACSSAPKPATPTPPSPTTLAPSDIAPLFADVFVAGAKPVFAMTTDGKTTAPKDHLYCQVVDVKRYARGRAVTFSCVHGEPAKFDEWKFLGT